MIIHVPPGPLDPVLRANRQPGTQFRLGDGVYTTRGAFAFEHLDCCMLAPECTLTGLGPHRTRIVATDVDIEVNGSVAHYVEVLTGGTRSTGSCAHLAMSGFTLDCSNTDVPTVGIHTWSRDVQLSNLRVEGVVGWRTWHGPRKEGFGIVVNNAGTDTMDGGVHLRDCTVVTRTLTGEENYCTGIYAGIITRNRPNFHNTVRRCRVVAPSRAHAAFGFNDNTRFEDCEDIGVRRSFFCDTGPSIDVGITRHRSQGCEWALDLRMPSHHFARRRITVADSLFVFTPDVSRWAQALLLDAQDDAVIERVTLEKCTFVAMGANASKGRMHGKNVRHIHEKSCTWIPHTPDTPWQDPIQQVGAEGLVE